MSTILIGGWVLVQSIVLLIFVYFHNYETLAISMQAQYVYFYLSYRSGSSKGKLPLVLTVPIFGGKLSSTFWPYRVT